MWIQSSIGREGMGWEGRAVSIGGGILEGLEGRGGKARNAEGIELGRGKGRGMGVVMMGLVEEGVRA